MAATLRRILTYHWSLSEARQAGTSGSNGDVLVPRYRAMGGYHVATYNGQHSHERLFVNCLTRQAYVDGLQRYACLCFTIQFLLHEPCD